MKKLTPTAVNDTANMPYDNRHDGSATEHVATGNTSSGNTSSGNTSSTNSADLRSYQCMANVWGQYYQAKAQRHAMTNFINCYLREFAIPNQEIDLDARQSDLPLCLTYSHSGPATQLLTIYLPESCQQDNPSRAASKIVVPVSYFSRLGKCQLAGSPWLKRSNQPWQSLSIGPLIDCLHDYLAARYQLTINQELREQIFNSIAVTQAFLQAPTPQASDCALTAATSNASNTPSANTPSAYNDFIRSEQSMLWGHAYHPSPKSRQGIEMAALLSHSPETRSQFALYWFKINPSLIAPMGKSALATLKATAQTLLADSPLYTGCSEPKSETTSPDDWVYYPCHPWEAQGILADSTIKSAINAGHIEPLGLTGAPVYPTSSVRSLYHSALTHFIKCSVHVRMTNCIRKNAWYELHSAVYLTQVLAPIYESKRLTNPTFKLMLEPAATTVDITTLYPEASAQSQTFIQEAFGLLFREAFSGDEIAHLTPQVAAALFTAGRSGQSVIAQHLEQLIGSQAKPTTPTRAESYAKIACLWLERYATILVTGAFDYFFNHGVVFEPHLQNTVIGMSQGLPVCVWIRDLEGTKLIDSQWSLDAVSSLSERTKASMRYSQSKGWSRIAYCVLINNLSEAIFYLCQSAALGDDRDLWSAEVLEDQLWQIVKEVLINWQLINGVQPEVEQLLAGGSIPSKNNYKTRLLQLADKHSSYVMLPCPWHASHIPRNNLRPQSQLTPAS